MNESRPQLSIESTRLFARALRGFAGPDRIEQKMQIEFPQPVLSPCIGICQLDEQGLCVGCLRSSDEIGRWLDMSAAEREHLMDTVLPLRQAGQA